MTTAIQLVQQACKQVVDAPVHARVPENRPQLFIRIDQAPPRRTSPVSERTLVIIQAYAPTAQAGFDLIEVIREHLFDEVNLPPGILGWEEDTGPHLFPDPDIPHIYRWQLTGTLFKTL